VLHRASTGKTDEALTSRLELTGIGATAAARAYRWTGGAIRRLADRAVPAGGFSATYPRRSATVYAIAG
jgi:hypothetical protein